MKLTKEQIRDIKIELIIYDINKAMPVSGCSDEEKQDIDDCFKEILIKYL